MAHILINEQIYSEAVELSMAKKYMKVFRDADVEKSLNNVFAKLAKLPNAEVSKRGDRIYLPFEFENYDSLYIENFKDIRNFIRVYDGVDITKDEYIKGVFKSPDGRDKKIGKFIRIKVDKGVDGAEKLLKRFEDDLDRNIIGKENLMVTISKHKYDIAGMSTGRGWTSCMNLYSFEDDDEDYIAVDISSGSFIAYLGVEKDKNLKKPFARTVAKPFVSTKDKTTYYQFDNDYGQTHGKFLTVYMNGILDKIGQPIGSFKLAQGVTCDYLPQLINNDDKFKDMIIGKYKITTKEDVVYFVESLGIKKYKVLDDNEVEIYESLNLRDYNTKKIPIKIKSINGDFTPPLGLRTLMNCPIYIDGDFTLIESDVRSLVGGPQTVTGYYKASSIGLTSLEGSPKICGTFDVKLNQLNSFKYSPSKITGDFFAEYNYFTNWDDFPKHIGGDAYISNNRATLKQNDAPEENVKGRIYF